MEVEDPKAKGKKAAEPIEQQVACTQEEILDEMTRLKVVGNGRLLIKFTKLTMWFKHAHA